MKSQEYFVSGIDTSCGKTFITGLLAKQLLKSKTKVITTKLVQTGCSGISEDIVEHRKIMDVELFSEDKTGLTCEYVFDFPASPHLASTLQNNPINLSVIRNSIKKLEPFYKIILSEGAGGLLVPLTENYLTIDYVSEFNIPLILIASSRLGSINHTLLSLEICAARNIDLRAVIYNEFPDDDKKIAANSYNYLKNYTNKIFPHSNFIHSDLLLKESVDLSFIKDKQF